MLLCHAFDIYICTEDHNLLYCLHLMVTVNEKASKEGNKIDRYTDCIVFVTQQLSTIKGKLSLNPFAMAFFTKQLKIEFVSFFLINFRQQRQK